MTNLFSNPFGETEPQKENGMPRRGLPEVSATFAENFDNPFFDEEDNETSSLKKAKSENSLLQFESIDLITKQLEENYKKQREIYKSGLKTTRFITAEILMEAPENYFDRFQKDLPSLVGWVQTKVTANNQSQLIGNAQANPTEDSYQERAYQEIQSLILEFLDRTQFRGIEKAIISAMAVNEILGFGPLDPLWRDRKIDEILANGPFDVQIEIFGQLKKVPACKFRNEEHLMNLLDKLYGAIGKQVSRMTPILAGRLHDNSRMHAVHSSVAPKGPNFSIRRHPEKFWCPQDIVNLGSASQDMMTDIGNLIYKGCSFLVIGGTSTGKTTLLNALSGFYRDDVRLLTLEDNLELKLNPRKLVAAPMECVPGRADRPDSHGVTMRDLVKSALRLRPDGIIVGEVRDGACFDLAQALNTGHFGASTVHANNEFDGMYRLISLVSQGELITGDNALPLIAAAFDFIILVEHFPQDGSRRITSVSEVAPMPEIGADGRRYLPTKNLWKFQNEGTSDNKIMGHWEKTGEMSDLRTERRHLNLVKNLTWEELSRLSSVPVVN